MFEVRPGHPAATIRVCVSRNRIRSIGRAIAVRWHRETPAWGAGSRSSAETGAVL